jgi:hypothetical protein
MIECPVIECAAVLNSWPIILISGAVGGVLGWLLGAIHATRKAERMIRGGRPRVQL